MDYAEVLTQLESYGSAQTRKTYTRHGLLGPMFGVKFGDLNKLRAKIKVDHELGLQLWHSGNLDARVLATMVLDPSGMTMKELTLLHKDVSHHGLSSALSNVAQRSPVAEKIMRKWMARKADLVQATGWMMLAGITRERPELFSAEQYQEFLKTLELEIHDAPNRTRHAMHSALIGIGTYIDEKRALSAAKKIGTVVIDHGDTSCKTQEAVPYIKKAAAKFRAKKKKTNSP